MSRVAVILPGNLGCYKVAIESIRENLVKPNDADMFILTSKKNYIHVVNDELAGRDHDQDLRTDGDEAEIRQCFGGSLKLFKFIEDIDGYEVRRNAEIVELKKRISWFTEGAVPAHVYDKEKREIRRPVRYIDPLLRMHYLMQMVCEHEKAHGIRYDWIIRARIDQIFCDPIVIRQGEGPMEQFYWTGVDNFFYGTRDVMEYVCLNFVHNIGAFDNPTVLDKGDYRLTTEPQFTVFVLRTILTRNIPDTRPPIWLGVILCSQEFRILIPEHPVNEADRRRRGLRMLDYYQVKKLDKPYYPVLDEMYPMVWAYCICANPMPVVGPVR